MKKQLIYIHRDFCVLSRCWRLNAEECRISDVQALKLGSCFGSGMRQGEVCEAVSGALMVLGLLYSKYKKVEPISR